MALTTAYGVFADGGRLHTPILIRRVEDANGHVLMESRSDFAQVISEQTAFQISTVLADVLDRGTGYKARQTGFRLPAAGKTGTTNEYRDAWFVGYTPDLVAGVWVGFDQPRTIVSGGYASELAVPIWGAFMRDATAQTPARRFARPPGIVAIEVCQDSGLLPGSACHRVETVSDDGGSRTRSSVAVEYFRRGTEPTAVCPLHSDSWFGGVRTASYDSADFPRSSIVRRLAAPPAASAAAHEVTKAASSDGADERERKPGFWSRFVGVFKGGKGAPTATASP
jgi:penicillin-binding protein 1A